MVKIELFLWSSFSGLLHKGLLHSTCVDGLIQQKGTQTPHDQHGLPLDIFEEVSFNQMVSPNNAIS